MMVSWKYLVSNAKTENRTTTPTAAGSGDTCIPDCAFTREGLAYARGFPTFSRWLHSFYLYVFPTFVALMSSWRIYADLPWSGSDGALRLLGLSASLLTLVVVAVYWYSRGREEID